MIISDLEHLEVVAETKEVEGGAAIVGIGSFTGLALGFKNAAIVFPVFEPLAVSSPGSNIAGLKFSFLAQAE
ncbi:MAG: hypothetical protein IGR93_05730 [Hydrococcus sp. C42_A2020_068]|uniref:hypothetical protein n=1 Tax=Pleurocapsa sp. PCC 7327 TaxID=118163 RepID=UPI00029FE243|nr:hypothetical protein [Pleurocapsa sp. PCC 7327]AFY77393.1 hypothetical protein Ple7327_2064 [Pleurocapsa sp. PCC 7327]MBF2019604.1 hypothetical protein [Hydrococcus sp. C42_A2020_068]